MNWIDFAILIIILLSAVISSLRGFTREALSLLGWALAFWVSMTFSGSLALLFKDTIHDAILRLIVAFLILFIASLIVSTIVNYFITQFVQRTGMTRADRSIGIVFGVLRGIMIIVALVLFAGLTPFPQTPSWHDSFFLYYFEGLAVWMRDLMPSDVAGSFVF